MKIAQMIAIAVWVSTRLWRSISQYRSGAPVRPPAARPLPAASGRMLDVFRRAVWGRFGRPPTSPGGRPLAASCQVFCPIGVEIRASVALVASTGPLTWLFGRYLPPHDRGRPFDRYRRTHGTIYRRTHGTIVSPPVLGEVDPGRASWRAIDRSWAPVRVNLGVL